MNSVVWMRSAARKPTTCTTPAWAWAGSTPYSPPNCRAPTSAASRNPMAVSWPKASRHDATPRPQFHHVIDRCADHLRTHEDQAAARGQRVPQDSIDGISMAYTFADPNAKGTKNDAVLRHHGQPGHLSRRLVCQRTGAARTVGGRHPEGCQGMVAGLTSGSFTTWKRTGARPTTSPPGTRRSWRK
jgi:arylsulfatase A-like enzyme